jgi:hypothetical protein
MKNLIKSILKESDFDWTNDSNTEVPIEEISEWVYETRYKISPIIKKIEEFYKQTPQVNWNDKVDMSDDDKMIALSVRSIGDELRNVYSSLETIDDEISYIKNPELFRDDE